MYGRSMKLVKKDWFLNGGISFDSDYQAVLDRATTLGYTQPSAAQQTKQNALVVALKSSGIWSQLDLLYVLATDGDRNYAAINWKAPASFKLVESNTPTFSSNIGFTGNASNMSLNTQWNVSSSSLNFTQDNACFFGYFSGTLNNNLAGTTVTRQCNYRVDTGRYYINSATPVNAALYASTPAFIHIQRTGSTNTESFLNGTSFATSTASTSGALSNSTLFILASNGGSFSNCTCGFFGVGSALTGKESALYTSWNTYFTSL